MCEDRLYMHLPPLKTWQFYHACMKVLGKAFLQKLFKRSQRQIHRWCADPDFCTDTERNPLDRLIVLLRRLCEIGREDVAVAGVRLVADAIGYDIVPRTSIEPDRPTVEEECLDDYPALLAFHNAIREGKSKEEVSYLAKELKKEIDQTLEKYKREFYG